MAAEVVTPRDREMWQRYIGLKEYTPLDEIHAYQTLPEDPRFHRVADHVYLFAREGISHYSANIDVPWNAVVSVYAAPSVSALRRTVGTHVDVLNDDGATMDFAPLLPPGWVPDGSLREIMRREAPGQSHDSASYDNKGKFMYRKTVYGGYTLYYRSPDLANATEIPFAIEFLLFNNGSLPIDYRRA